MTETWRVVQVQGGQSKALLGSRKPWAPHLADLTELGDRSPALAVFVLEQALDLAHAILNSVEGLLGFDKLAQAFARRRQLIPDGRREGRLDRAVLGLEPLAQGRQLREVRRRQE